MDATTRRELDELRAEVAHLRKRTERHRRRAGGRWLGVALVVVMALLPATLGASDRFDDVPAGAYFHGDASAIADAGITRGCFDTQHFCPDDTVTRGQMAAFLARTAGLGGNPPVANALTAQTVPDGSVTAAKLSGAGAQPGQALVATSGGVAWQATGSFGASVYRSSASFTGCVETPIATLPVTVGTPARLYATGTGSFQGNGVAGAFVNVRVRLRDQADTTTLALSGTLAITNTSNLYDGIPWAAGGVLHTLEPPFFPGDERPTASAYVAPSGTYLVQLLVSRGGSCGPGGFVQGIALTALQLSGAP